MDKPKDYILMILSLSKSNIRDQAFCTGAICRAPHIQTVIGFYQFLPGHEIREPTHRKVSRAFMETWSKCQFSLSGCEYSSNAHVSESQPPNSYVVCLRRQKLRRPLGWDEVMKVAPHNGISSRLETWKIDEPAHHPVMPQTCHDVAGRPSPLPLSQVLSLAVNPTNFSSLMY